MNFQFLHQWRSYYGSTRSMEPGLGTQEGPARDRQFFFILIFCFHNPMFLTYPHILLSLRFLQMHIPINMLT
jgi:hypothetical protein